MRGIRVLIGCVLIVGAFSGLVGFASTRSATQEVRMLPMGGGALIPPRLVSYAHPFYTDEAQKRAVEGTVTIEAAIEPDGRARPLRIVKGLGFGLDENAALALREWRFTPATRGLDPVEARVEIDMDFKLSNAPSSELLSNVVSVRSGVTEPKLVNKVEPEYSPEAAASRVEGAVTLDAVILEDGSVRVVRLVGGLGSGLDEKAIKAIEQWKFSPALKDGKAVRIRTDVAIRFSHDK
jgi:TonB family protein